MTWAEVRNFCDLISLRGKHVRSFSEAVSSKESYPKRREEELVYIRVLRSSHTHL